MTYIVVILLVLAVAFFILGVLADYKKKKIEREEIENTITQTLRIRDINPDYKKNKKESEENEKPVMLKSIMVKDKVELYDDEEI